MPRLFDVSQGALGPDGDKNITKDTLLTKRDVTGWIWMLLMSQTRYAITVLAEVIMFREGHQISNEANSSPFADPLTVSRFGMASSHYTNMFRELNVDFADNELRHSQLGHPLWYTVEGANLPM